MARIETILSQLRKNNNTKGYIIINKIKFKYHHNYYFYLNNFNVFLWTYFAGFLKIENVAYAKLRLQFDQRQDLNKHFNTAKWNIQIQNKIKPNSIFCEYLMGYSCIFKQSIYFVNKVNTLVTCTYFFM